MMVGGSECPNCGEYTNASNSRLVRDACGHKKCRMCLVYEEDGCKTCQSEHRLQMIGNFDYPVPSSPLVFVSVDSCGSNAGSEKEEIALQPLELVTHKTLDHDGDPLRRQESYRSKGSACRSEWADDRDMGSRNVLETRTVDGKTSRGMDVRGLSQNDCIPAMRRHVILDTTDFGASERTIELQKSVLPHAHAPKMEPLELVTNIRASLENEGNRQDATVHTITLCEKNEDRIDSPAKEATEKPKRRRNCKVKRSHISAVPGIQEAYKCSICNKTFKSTTAQRYHDSCLTGKKPYQCTICDRSFVKQSHFQYHERTHTGYKPFKCSLCGKAFPQRNKLNRHLYSHQVEKRFKCSTCEKRYSSQEDLKSHMNIHLGIMPYTCQICKKSFREAAILTRHMHTHSDERPHMCEQCGKSFKDKSLLVRHRRTHGKERPFSCSDCARVFLSKSELSRHLAVHSDDKPFTCRFCNTVFRRKDNLNRHTRHHHSEDRMGASEARKSNREEDETWQPKSKAANVFKPKTKPKEKAKSVSGSLPKSPARIPGLYLNPHEQSNSRLDSRSNVIPVIRTTNELSNAVPVINGPISIKRPEETTNSPKKAFAHTEPIPLAEAVVINRRIEEKLYPKTNSNHDCYFRSDFRNRVERQHNVPKIRPPRSNLSNKTMSVGKIYSPERSFYEHRGPTTPINRTEKYVKTQSFVTKKHFVAENGIASPEMFAPWSDCQDNKGANRPRHTVPKKRAIEELKSKPMAADSLDFPSIPLQEGPCSSGTVQPERANCVPTITKAGHANGTNDFKEFNLPEGFIGDTEIYSESRSKHVENVGNPDVETCNNLKKVSNVHWRRRTSEILRPRIQGFDSLINCQLSELEMTDGTSDDPRFRSFLKNKRLWSEHLGNKTA